MNASNLFRKFFRDSLGFCFTPKTSKETDDDVAIKKATKPLQSCACERTHEHLAMYGFSSSRNYHLGVERHEMTFGVFYAHKNNLECYVVSWYDNVHDLLREWLGASS